MNHPKKDQRPAKARKEELVVQELPDEILVYDLKDHKAHCLNPTAAFVWNHCDGHTTVTEIAALMEKEWSQQVTDDVVWLALKQLSRAGLLEEKVSTAEDGMRASRRAVLRKLGAAAAMTPLVISIVAPPASAGASVPPACTTCTSFAGQNKTCPPLCGPTIIGCCFNNASCDTGQGGPLGALSCPQCLATPTASGWRFTGAPC